jgi:hypothetical protein
MSSTALFRALGQGCSARSEGDITVAPLPKDQARTGNRCGCASLIFMVSGRAS